MSRKIVEFKDVLKEYGEGDGKQIAVNHIDFDIEEGEFVVILGQSGAGKSTVLNMLGGMDKPTSGKVIVDDVEVSAMNDKQLSDYRAEKVGFIFQFYNLLPSLTALENVALTKNIVKDALNPMEMLERVGLENHAKKFPAQMSGGEQQRVSIARALAKNPKIILGDEPTGALDSDTGVM
ncbi:MAG: ABC transporter ATP-binding protein, partial [Lachnospiraceae bacterium]|nr:ABC transporter ATP-binding protein [Lachnospiraceae bacterium]